MPKILPTFAAIAIVGVCIALNTMRYPIVWEMVGPSAQWSLSEKNAPAAEVALSAEVAPAAEAASSSTAAQSPSQPTNVSATTESQSIAKEIAKPALPQAIPISLPKEELVAKDAEQDAEKTEKGESSGASAADENLVEPPRRLVPVAKDAISAGSPDARMDEIRRLPPVEAEIAYPADRYAAEYPSSAIPIYPSTGK